MSFYMSRDALRAKAGSMVDHIKFWVEMTSSDGASTLLCARRSISEAVWYLSDRKLSYDLHLILCEVVRVINRMCCYYELTERNREKYERLAIVSRELYSVLTEAESAMRHSIASTGVPRSQEGLRAACERAARGVRQQRAAADAEANHRRAAEAAYWADQRRAAEAAEAERRRAEAEQRRAEAEQRRAEAERRRAEAEQHRAAEAERRRAEEAHHRASEAAEQRRNYVEAHRRFYRDVDEIKLLHADILRKKQFAEHKLEMDAWFKNHKPRRESFMWRVRRRIRKAFCMS